ncbi:glycosyltransferase family 2 protein [Clostridium frigidicarnis]|nr:glycosyltransferase family 2 protein [Clostridium frigidicarnis]
MVKIDMVDVSIIIPAYNVEKYIGRTLNSAINQTFKNIEIIVINDGSEDNTHDIIEEYANVDSRIKVIQKENKGVSSARNQGIKSSVGDYLMFLDGDDWVENTAVEEMYSFLINEDGDILVSDFYLDYGKKIMDYYFEFNDDSIDNIEYIKKILLGQSSGVIWNKMFKRKLFIEHNILFPENITLGEDACTLIKLIYNSKKIIKFNKSFVHYIQRPERITATNNEKSYSIYDSVICLTQYFYEIDLYHKLKDEIEFFEYLYVFYYRVIEAKTNNEVTVDMYCRWKNTRKKIRFNIHYKNFINSLSFNKRLKSRLVLFNYNLACIIFKFTKRFNKDIITFGE